MSAKIIQEIRAATRAEDEDIKAMLTLHDGDANAAILALLETPFQKVDNKKHHKASAHGAMAPSRHYEGGSGRGDRSGAPYPRRDGAGGGGRGAGRGGRAEGRGGGAGPAYGGRGAGRGSSAPPGREPSKPKDPDNNGNHAEPSGAGAVETSVGSGWPTDSTSSRPAPSGGAWGAPAPSAAGAASAPPAGAWGAGTKTLAERMKQQVVKPPAPVAAAPVYDEPVEDSTAYATGEDLGYEPDYAGEYTEETGAAWGEAEQAEGEALAVPEADVAPTAEAETLAAPAAQPTPAYQGAPWSNADAAKNLLNSLKGNAAAAAAPAPPSPMPAPAAQQPAAQPAAPQPAAAAAPQQILTAEAPAPAPAPAPQPVPTHYGTYVAPSAPSAMPTAAEIEAQNLQLSFGTFGLGEFGSNFGGYAAPPAEPSAAAAPSLMQQAPPGPSLQAPAPTAPQQADPYKPSAYNGYGAYSAGDKVTSTAPAPAAPGPAPQPAAQPAPGAFSSFGQGAGAGGFGGAFSSGFGAAPQVSEQAPQAAAAAAFETAAQHAFSGYGQDASSVLKQQQQQQAYGSAAPPGMGGYGMQQQSYQQQQPAGVGAGAGAFGSQQAGAGKPLYNPYAQAAPQQQQQQHQQQQQQHHQQQPQQQAQQQQQQGAAADQASTAASSASVTGLTGLGAGAGGLPAAPAGVPHQMHFAAAPAAAAAAAVQPGMGQYGAGLYNQPYPQYNQPYPMANMGYNAYNMSYGYQQGGYPPQPTPAYAPNAAAAYSVPHTQQGAPRGQHSYSNPYSAPTQAGGPGAQGANPAAYGAAAGQPYGLGEWSGYEDMSSSAAGAVGAGSYGLGKDKDAGMYGAQQGTAGYPGQHARGNNYGSYPTQPYAGQAYNQAKGGYSGYNRQYGQQQQYGGPAHGGQGGYSKPQL